jgi:hypothetical protein
MSKVFVEYKIIDGQKNDFLAFMEKRRKAETFGLFEGSDQPGLFVEIWDGLSVPEYRDLKRKRLEETDSPWRAMDSMVDGGPAKLHIWHFNEIV